MIRVAREVDLLSYLPPFMAEFKEIAVTLDAENPEFVLVWKAADRVLQNEFIETADEYGISRFEKILNILPSKEDTLESRRSRVFARWFNTIPYTLKALIAKLEALCGDSDFTIIKEYDNYTITMISSTCRILPQPSTRGCRSQTVRPSSHPLRPCPATAPPLWKRPG